MDLKKVIAELTEERRRIKATIQPFLTRIQAIDVAVEHLRRLDALQVAKPSFADLADAVAASQDSKPSFGDLVAAVGELRNQAAHAPQIRVHEDIRADDTASVRAAEPTGSVTITPSTGSLTITPEPVEIRVSTAPPQVLMGAPYWKWAVQAFDTVGHALRIPDLVRIIRALGGPKIDRESLRTIVRMRPEFEPVGDAFYALRDWPDEKKNLRIEGH